jgi:uncharacterized coiled-coil protein SlyX
MKPSIKTVTLPLLILFALCSFALSPQTQAVNPPLTPDPPGPLPVSNTADGHNALLSLTTGIYNSAFGFDSLLSLTDGNFCTAVGGATLILNTGSENTAIGAGALLSNSTGTQNTADGAFALFNNTTGNANTAVGDRALLSNTTEGNNTAIGFQALNNSTGALNIAVGWEAGTNLTTGISNIDIGNPGVAGESGTIRIGGSGLLGQSATFIAGINGVTLAAGAAVQIDASGQLGTVISSRRFKKDIKPMDTASEAILALKPVTFHYKSDKTGTPQFGLIAEEVAAVNPDLVVRDEKGEIYTVRYDAISAMLLNEFLKEHKKVEDQQAMIADLKSTVANQEKRFTQQEVQIEALTSGLQKVSAQLEISKPVPQVVLNNP